MEPEQVTSRGFQLRSELSVMRNASGGRIENGTRDAVDVGVDDAEGLRHGGRQCC